MTGRLHVQWGEQSHLISMGSSTFLGPKGRVDQRESGKPGPCAWISIHRSGARYLLKPLRPVVLEGAGGRSQRVVVVSPGELVEITAIWGEHRHHVSWAIEGSGAPAFRAHPVTTPESSGNDNWSTPLTSSARTVREFEAALLSKPLPIPDDVERDFASATALAATSWLGSSPAYAPAVRPEQKSQASQMAEPPGVVPSDAGSQTAGAGPVAVVPAPEVVAQQASSSGVSLQEPASAPELAVHIRDMRIVDSAGRVVVDGLSFDIAPRSVVALVGPPGGGMSLVAAALAGRHASCSGSLHLASRPLKHGFPPGTCGFVSGESLPHTTLTVLETLTRAAMTVTRSPREAKRSANAIIDHMNLGDVAKLRVARLPHDVQFMVAFAEEALRRPQVIVVDGIVDALPQQQRECFLSVATQVAQEGTSVVLTAQGHHHFPAEMSVVPVDSAEPCEAPVSDLPEPDRQGAMWTYAPRRRALRRKVAQDAAPIYWNQSTKRACGNVYTAMLMVFGPLLTVLFAAALADSGLANEGPTPYLRIPGVLMALIAGVAVQATLVGTHPVFAKWDAIARDVQWGYSVRSAVAIRMVGAVLSSAVVALLTVGLYVAFRPSPDGVGHLSGLVALAGTLALMSVCQTLLSMALVIAVRRGVSFAVGLPMLLTVVLSGLPIALATAPGVGGYVLRAIAAMCPGRWAVVALAAPLHLGQVVPAPDPAWGHSAGETAAAWVVMALLSGLFAIFACVAATIRCSRARRRA